MKIRATYQILAAKIMGLLIMGLPRLLPLQICCSNITLQVVEYRETGCNSR